MGLNLIILDYLIFSKLQLGESKQSQNKIENPTNSETQESACGQDCRDYIDQAVSSFSSKLTPSVTARRTPTPVTKTVSQTSSAVKEFFVTLGQGSTASSDWTDIPGAQSYIDKSKYPSIQSSAFEVSVTNPNASQEVYVRLYNVTEGTVVSQMTLAGDSKLVYGYFSLSAGNKLYQVQMKTQLNATATLNLSRVRISVN